MAYFDWRRALLIEGEMRPSVYALNRLSESPKSVLCTLNCTKTGAAALKPNGIKGFA